MFGDEGEVEGTAFMGDPDAILKVLLPRDPRFDLAMNVFTFQPGASLPLVEVHVMEHGLLMLDGKGVYRLDDDWYPVRQGDVIWMRLTVRSGSWRWVKTRHATFITRT